MRTMAIAFILLSHLISFGANAQEFDKEQAVSEAKVITKTFAEALKKELVSAMQAGGPLNAIEACNVQAMPITSHIANEKNAQISRVSLKNRNPINIPNDWQRSVLEDFNERAAKGEDIEKMASVAIVDNSDSDKAHKKQIRFMKALPTGGVCLACHGEQLSGDLKSRLNELYPNDKATGYSLGQVRGAIVVVKDY